MALNSNIRNIPLLGNVDLTNYHADIHDYEGFVKDNSFFLNKRKVNWWVREDANGEVGGLRGLVNGDFFDIYKGLTKIGSVSRSYYNLETVSPTAYEEEETFKIYNPIKSALIILPNKKKISIDKCFYDSCTVNSNYWECFVDFETSETWFLKNGVQQQYFTISNIGSIGNDLEGINLKDVVFSFLVPGYINDSPSFPTPYFSDKLTFQIDTGYLFFAIPTDGKIKALQKSRSISAAFGWTYPLFEGSKHYYIRDSNYYVNGGIFFENHEGGDDYRRFDFFPFGKNQIILFIAERGTVGSVSGVDGKFAICRFARAGYIKEWEYFLAPSSSYESISLEYTFNKEATENVINFKYNNGSLVYVKFNAQSVYSNNLSYSMSIHKFLNYSQIYGIWAINFINGVAQNIAHNYKKLFELEGNEDENGQLLDIDGYNNNAIYFHYGEQFYKISISETDNFSLITKNVSGVYYIFNTVSYENAYYYNNDDWFCSCDDWNNRIFYYHNEKTSLESECNSRLGKNWQTSNNVVSVSQEYANVLIDLPTQNRSISINKIKHTFLDESYTAPIFLNHNKELVAQSYDLYFPSAIPLDSLPTVIKQGSFDAENGVVWNQDSGDIWATVESWQMQNTPCLLDLTILLYPLSAFIINKEGVYKALTSSSLQGEWVLIYLNNSESDPLDLGDNVFIINGVEYTYRSKTNRILDYTGQFVCNTNMLKYIGYSTQRAYFYSEFDKAIYIFEGNNAVKKLAPLEGYSINFKVFEEFAGINTLNIPSLDVLLVELTTAVLVLFEEQYILLNTGVVNSWSVDINNGTFVINGLKYSLNRSSLSIGNNNNNNIYPLPIKIETQFYGTTNDVSNTVNDCVYLTIDNLSSLSNGIVKIQTELLQNQKVVKSEIKTMILKSNDFNNLAQCLIKYQPALQEAKGFKLLIESDFEISSLKIGTSQGAMNQTSKRI